MKNKKKLRLVLGVPSVCLVFLICWAAEGELDLTFGTGGKVTTDFLGSNNEAYSDIYNISRYQAVAAMQPDGKYVIAGTTSSTGFADFAIARHNLDGSLDITFGEAGHVITDLTQSADIGTSLAIQPDGKILVAGSVYSGTTTQYDFAVVRYNPDGTLDSDFGIGGKVVADFQLKLDKARGIAVQNDGKIVVAGTASLPYPRYQDFALVRYNENGSLDTSFGNGGYVTTNFFNDASFDNDDDAWALKIQPGDQKILVTGTARRTKYFATARYNPDGSLDTGFGTNGLVTTPVTPRQYPCAYSIEVQTDNKIVLAGNFWTDNVNSTDIVLIRYNPNGSLDPGFGNGGIVTAVSSGTDYGYDLAIQSDGKIIITGSSSYKFYLVRFNTNGSLDQTFGDNGKVTTAVRGYAWSVDVQADGKIIVAGTGGYVQDDMVLARFETWGGPDSGFGENGFVFDDFIGPNRDFGKDIICLQADGKIVMIGVTEDSGSLSDFAMARYQRDGSLDTSFGNLGKVTTDFATSYDEAHGIAIQTDGKLVVAGRTQDALGNGTHFAVARYNQDGSLDSSFGNGGKVITAFGSSDWDDANSVAVQADGRIVVAGQAGNIGPGTSYHNDFGLARYNTDGSLDTSFGNSGLVLTNIVYGQYSNSNDICNAIAVQNDGKIVAVGHMSYNDMVVVRYYQNGFLDSSFGTGGIVRIDLGKDWIIAYGVLVQNDGKIVLVGSYNRPSPYWRDWVLARLDSNGNLDTFFGNGGLVFSNLASYEEAYDLAFQADGKILIAGQIQSGDFQSGDFVLARYNSNGSLDTGFANVGLITTDFGNKSDLANSLAIQADGKILVAGYSDSGFPTGHDFAMARYIGTANQAPVANAGPDQLIEAMGQTTPFSLNGAGSSDPDGDLLTYKWEDANGNVVGEAATIPQERTLGTYSFKLTVTDPGELSSEDTVTITIQDTTPPAITAPADVTVDQSDPYGTPVTLGSPTVSDLCDPSPTVVNSAPALFPLSETMVTWTATDASGNSATATQKVTVVPGSPANQLSNLTKLILYSVAAGAIDPELETSLMAKVAAASDALAKANPSAATVAMNDLKALVNQVEAQTDKKITPEIAAEIIAWANRVITDLGG
jgi:uncharacterized delta-60 repeat protein